MADAAKGQIQAKSGRFYWDGNRCLGADEALARIAKLKGRSPIERDVHSSWIPDQCCRKTTEPGPVAPE
jgi:hypothetical protein